MQMRARARARAPDDYERIISLPHFHAFQPADILAIDTFTDIR